MATIKERILARADLAEAMSRRDTEALAAGLNEQPEFARGECWVDALGIINRCTHGKSILRKLKAGAAVDAIVEVAWNALNGKGLDFGADSTLASIDEMAPALDFTVDEAEDLRALAPLCPVYVSRLDIADAMFNDDGSLK
jgi:hypothetical protein